MTKSLRLVGACALALAITGGGSAWAAPGGGAVVAPATCVVSIPGFPSWTTTGAGSIVVTPSGNQHTVCHAQLPVGTPGPAKAMRFDFGPCAIVVSTSGNVLATCNFR